MRSLYILLFFIGMTGTVYAQTPSDLDFVLPERVETSRSVRIYPNPAADEFVHVRIDHINIAGVKVSLHNLIGNEMRVEKDLVDENTLRIKVKDLAAGYYLIGLNDETQKLKGIYKFLKL
jgi:hypothetical protein